MQQAADVLEFNADPEGQGGWLVTIFAIGSLAIFGVVFQKIHEFASWAIIWVPYLLMLIFAVATAVVREHVVISKEKGELIRLFTIMGILPIGRKKHRLEQFCGVRRQVIWDRSDYDNSMYMQRIALVSQSGGDLVIQRFMRTSTLEHPLADKNALRLAEFLGLGVERYIAYRRERDA